MAELVYIVDDEPNILQLVSLGLDDAGFDTQTFSDGEKLFGCRQKTDAGRGDPGLDDAPAGWHDHLPDPAG